MWRQPGTYKAGGSDAETDVRRPFCRGVVGAMTNSNGVIDPSEMLFIAVQGIPIRPGSLS